MLLFFQPDLGVIGLGGGGAGGVMVVGADRTGEQQAGDQRQQAAYHLACRPALKLRGRPGAKVSKPELTPVLSA